VNIRESLHTIQESISYLHPEFVLTLGILVVIIVGLFKKLPAQSAFLISVLVYGAVVLLIIMESASSAKLFNGLVYKEGFSTYLKILMNVAGFITCIMSISDKRSQQAYGTEYYALLLTVVLGGHFLVMSNNLLMVFLSMEIVSISSYVLVGYSLDKKSSEGSLKYFLFGSVASAFMLYGFSILYGVTGTLNFLSEDFTKGIIENNAAVVLVAGFMSLAGFLFKISAAPMHPWAPDVYESAPVPVVAFLSVAPKIAGVGILVKFILAINAYGQSYDWQTLIAVIAILTLTVGNFSALAQKNAKRMMAYSSIAQSGFLLVGVAAFLPQGLQFMLFYATIYLIMNFIVFVGLQFFETRNVVDIQEYSGKGKSLIWASVYLLIGLVALTGLPPTAGFTGKLFIFSSLWESYQVSGKNILLWLLVFGLLNTVVSLFYYLKIPYYAFLKEEQSVEKQKFISIANLLSLILVLAVLAMFFAPGLLMSWINKVNFV
jgi:NADH-quinone oxidoreductase subunit N